MSAQIQKARVGGRWARYLEVGDPVAPRALVLVHAFPVGVQMWTPQVEAFPDWRVILPALPGFDGSDLLDTPSVEECARHILGLLDVLGVPRAVVGGVSLGGYVTFAILREAPDRVDGVILADTRSTADTPEALGARRRLLETTARSGPAGVAAEMVPKLLGKTTLARRAAVVEQVQGMIERQTPDGIAAAIRMLMSRPDSTPLLPAMRVPAAIIVGEEDVLTPPADAEAMHAAIPQSTLSRIPEAGHLSNIEHPAAFDAAVAAFLAHLR